jgi:hypothetical protein
MAFESDPIWGTGIPGSSSTLQIPGHEIVRRLVLDNQLMMGSGLVIRQAHDPTNAIRLCRFQRI